jgi:hypothetical protein
MENIHHHAPKVDFVSAFNYGWEVVKKHWKFLLLATFITFLVTLPFSILDSLWTGSWRDLEESGYVNFRPAAEMFSYAVFMILIYIVSFTLSFNMKKIYLNILHGHKLNLEDVYKLPSIETFRYTVAVFAYGIMLLVAFGLAALSALVSYLAMIAFDIPLPLVVAFAIVASALFIVFGIYLAIRYMFMTTLVIDKKMGIFEAGRESTRMTEGHGWDLLQFLFMVAVVYISILIVGLLCFIIGVIPAIFIASWIGTFSLLYVYRKLSQ